MPDERDYMLDTDLPVLRHLTYVEWHAAWNGFVVGLTPHLCKRGCSTRREVHYWRFGFLVGWLVQVALIVWIADSVIL